MRLSKREIPVELKPVGGSRDLSPRLQSLESAAQGIGLVTALGIQRRRALFTGHQHLPERALRIDRMTPLSRPPTAGAAAAEAARKRLPPRSKEGVFGAPPSARGLAAHASVP